MEKLKIWVIQREEKGETPRATSLQEVRLEKEADLEDLLSRNPDLLEEGLQMVGRQVPTATGSLDLLGVDGEGRLVVFELKRDTPPREAVAQVIDYASYLSSLDIDSLVKHLAQLVNAQGREDMEDFEGWYEDSFGTSLSDAIPPRMVLVGLGVDEATERMVRFLSESGVDISLITFHAFQHQGRTLLARQVSEFEVKPPSPRYTKAENEKAVSQLATQLNVERRFTDMRSFIRRRLPRAYEGVRKTLVNFQLADRTEQGTLSHRVYLALTLDVGHPGRIDLAVQPRAMELMKEECQKLFERFKPTVDRWGIYYIGISSDEEWQALKADLGPLLERLHERWEARLEGREEEAET